MTLQQDAVMGRHCVPSPPAHKRLRWTAAAVAVTATGLAGWTVLGHSGPGSVTTARSDLTPSAPASAAPATSTPADSAAVSQSSALLAVQHGAVGRTAGRSPSPTAAPAAPATSPAAPAPAVSPSTRSYPLHTGVRTTWFNVGGVDNPDGGEETQNVGSAWDAAWSTHFGGCDGVGPVGPQCIPEPRVASNDWFPQHMTPMENPFYVAIPLDDVNDATAAAARSSFPWAHDPDSMLGSPSTSLVKNRWVAVTGPNGRTCYAQVEDAGPWSYHDVAYVFSAAPPVVRPSLDVSPSVFNCIGVDLDVGETTTSWRFVDSPPPGPWTNVVTTRR
ncbi:MAG TPA: hypothetical protein VFP72_13780 [Kineosporiaceae bacterium]|nr:hypothetical protein [Kineosporiaceae bacterium]